MSVAGALLAPIIKKASQKQANASFAKLKALAEAGQPSGGGA